MEGRHGAPPTGECKSKAEDYETILFNFLNYLRKNTIMKKRSSSDKVNAKPKTKTPKERSMNTIKYIGMDVHMATTVIAIRNSTGKVMTEVTYERQRRRSPPATG